jgi:hypothetical protein
MSVVIHPNGCIAINPVPGICYQIAIAKQQSADVKISVTAHRVAASRQVQPVPPPQQALRPRWRRRKVAARPVTERELDIELLEYMAAGPYGSERYFELQALAEHDTDARAALERVNAIRNQRKTAQP